MKRAEHVVTLRPSGITFYGLVYGFTPGCWIISKRDAKRICNVYGCALPRCGYDRMLDSTGQNYITNISNAEYRVSLRSLSYDHARTGNMKTANTLA